MSRPRTVSYGGGEIILKGLSTEQSDMVEKLLSGEVAPPPVFSQLEDTAFGLKKNSAGNWEIVSVKYNSQTLQSVVTEVEDAGKNIYRAQEQFRLKVGKNLL